MTTFSASLTNLTALLPQSRDRIYYVSTPILGPPPLWLLKQTYLRAYDFAHSPNVWHQPRLTNVTCAWSWSLCGTNPYIRSRIYKLLLRGRSGLVETNKDRFLYCITLFYTTKVGTLIVATIYLQLIQNRYMFRSFTVLHCSHQHCVQPVASDVEVVGFL